MPTKDLESRIEEKKEEVWARISYQEKYYWIHTDQMVHKNDLAGSIILERQETVYSSPNGKQTKIASKGSYPICSTQGKWIELCKMGWVSSPFVQWNHQLKNSFAFTLLPTNIFHKADLLYPLQMVPKGVKLQVIGETKEFYQVFAFARSAFIRKQDVLTLDKFKTHNVYLPDLVTNVKPSIDGTEVVSIKGESFVTQVELRQLDWNRSVVKGHGSVWWREETARKEKDSALFHVKDIMSRKVFDIAKHPTKNLTVVSADGVYRSFDGTNWEKIEYFQNKNFAIAFSPQGELFVGDTRSDDLGERFQRYVRWDQMLRELGIRADAQDFSIQEIRFDQESIILHVKKQNKDFYVSSKDNGKSWKAHHQNEEESIIDTL